MRISKKTKKLLTTIACVALVVIVIGFTVSLFGNEDTDYKTKFVTWKVGSIDQYGKHLSDSEGTLYTPERIDCTGIEIYTEFDTDYSITVFYYDENDSFISQEVLENGHEYSIENFPEGAVGLRLTLLNNEDEDGKIGLLEKGKYTSKVTIKVSTAEGEAD